MANGKTARRAKATQRGAKRPTKNQLVTVPEPEPAVKIIVADEPIRADIVPMTGRADELSVVPEAAKGQGKSQAAQLGRRVVRWLGDQRRRGGALTLEQQEDIVNQARAAWRAALTEASA